MALLLEKLDDFLEELDSLHTLNAEIVLDETQDLMQLELKVKRYKEEVLAGLHRLIAEVGGFIPPITANTREP